jgi:three-Cys-motif partner protein
MQLIQRIDRPSVPNSRLDVPGTIVEHYAQRLRLVQEFGGIWTDRKIEKLKRYLELYSRALKNQRFRRLYADAFAGTGSRSTRRAPSELPFDPADLAEFAKGSARIALEIEPPFDEYIFIEKSRTLFAQLRATLTEEYADRSDRMTFVKGDANEAVAKLCAETNWRSTRCVLFLDPFGMQVDWHVVEAAARTRAIDLVYLVPTGIGVARLMPAHGEIPEEWQSRLDRMLGDRGWRQAFYPVAHASDDLFGRIEPQRKREADIDAIERYFLCRLRSVFADGVSSDVFRLGPRGRALYMLAFACGNPNGRALAHRLWKAASTR